MSDVTVPTQPAVDVVAIAISTSLSLSLALIAGLDVPVAIIRLPDKPELSTVVPSFTVNFSVGAVVPMPTLPPTPLMTILSVPPAVPSQVRNLIELSPAASAKNLIPP